MPRKQTSGRRKFATNHLNFGASEDNANKIILGRNTSVFSLLSLLVSNVNDRLSPIIVDVNKDRIGRMDPDIQLMHW